MPVYEYECRRHGYFEAMRPMSESRDHQPCPQCSRASPRVILSAAAVPFMAPAARRAHSTNERAQHEPKSSAHHVHGKHCGCSNRKSNSASTAGGGKAFPARRPWMISH
jgi:putative FmdB family regulatory protein